MHEHSIPVVREEVDVSRRRRETGVVRIRKLVREHEVVLDEPVLREEVDVERVPVGREVEAAAPPRQEGDVLVVPVYEEVLVVRRQLMLKEELRIRRRASTVPHAEKAVLREETLVVEREQFTPTNGQQQESKDG